MTLAPAQGRITPDLLSDTIRNISNKSLDFNKGTVQEITNRLEQVLVKEAIEEAGGNRTRAAQKLGLSRRGLLNKITELLHFSEA